MLYARRKDSNHRADTKDPFSDPHFIPCFLAPCSVTIPWSSRSIHNMKSTLLFFLACLSVVAAKQRLPGVQQRRQTALSNIQHPHHRHAAIFVSDDTDAALKLEDWTSSPLLKLRGGGVGGIVLTLLRAAIRNPILIMRKHRIRNLSMRQRES